MTEREMSYGTGGTRSGRSRSEDYSDPFDTQYGEKAQTKASEYGEKAQMKADQGLDKAATAADKAASQLREKAMQQGGKTGEIGTKVADKRARYAGRLDALAVLLAAAPAQWIGDRSFLGARTSH